MYKETLREFFKYVKDNKITRIVVDLRDNNGGDLFVLDEFMKYINVEKFTFWNDNKKEIEHYNFDLYDGDIYVAITNSSFSAASLFADSIKYNHLGLVIGEPTGNATTLFGNAKLLELPNTKIKYFVTTRKFYITNTEYKPAVEPDIYIPLTIKNIVDGTDPIEEWIKNTK